MDITVSLDSFQLIVGAYLLYVAAKGSGTLYRFFDLPDEQQPRVHRVLRRVYAVCGALALAEALICMFLGASQGSERLRSAVSLGLSGLVIVILVAAFVWLRRLAEK